MDTKRPPQPPRPESDSQSDPWLVDWLLEPARVAMLVLLLTVFAAGVHAPKAVVVVGLVIAAALLFRSFLDRSR